MKSDLTKPNTVTSLVQEGPAGKGKASAPPTLPTCPVGTNQWAWDKWCFYIANLDWSTGNTKHVQQFDSFLRAASLKIPPKAAVQEVTRRIELARGMLLPHEVRRQAERAYDWVQCNSEKSDFGSLLPHQGQDHKSKAQYQPQLLSEVAATATIPDLPMFLLTKSSRRVELMEAKDFLDEIFLRGEKVIFFTKFKSQGQGIYEIGTEAELPEGGPDGVWYLSNPVDGLYHPNPRQDNKPSRRSEESVTAWRHAVLESDVAPMDEWLRALIQFPLPIIAIYTSGGKSIHALVKVDALSKKDWDTIVNRWKPYLIKLGADPGALTAVRLTRLPQCFRGESYQRLLYVNPGADGTPIMELPERLDEHVEGN